MQTGQAEKYTYAVLGAGRQGTAAAYDMAKFGQASKVTIGESERALSTICARMHRSNVQWRSAGRSARDLR